MLSSFKIINLRTHCSLPIILYFSHFFGSVGEFILLGCNSISHAVVYWSFGCYCLFRLDPIVLCIYLGSFNSFSSIDIFPTIILFHHFVQITAPFLFENRFEKLILVRKLEELLSHKIFEYIVCSSGHYWAK